MKFTRKGLPPSNILNTMNTAGNLPTVGSQAPALENLICKDWKKFNPQETCKGKASILNIYPGILTPTCGKTVREFNKRAAALSNTVVLCISADTPSALGTFCGSDITSIIPLSAFRRDCNFGDSYGVRIVDGVGAGQSLPEEALKDLFARVLIAIDPNGKVIYCEPVLELTNEPNYDACLAAVAKATATTDTKTAADSQTAATSTLATAASSTTANSSANSPTLILSGGPSAPVAASHSALSTAANSSTVHDSAAKMNIG